MNDKFPFGSIRNNSADYNYGKRPSNMSEDFLLQFLNSNHMCNPTKESIENDLGLFGQPPSLINAANAVYEEEKQATSKIILKEIEGNKNGNNAKLHESVNKSDFIFRVLPDTFKSALWDQVDDAKEKEKPKVLSKKRGKNSETISKDETWEVDTLKRRLNGGTRGSDSSKVISSYPSDKEGCNLLNKVNESMIDIDNTIKYGSITNIHTKIIQTQNNLNLVNELYGIKNKNDIGVVNPSFTFEASEPSIMNPKFSNHLGTALSYKEQANPESNHELSREMKMLKNRLSAKKCRDKKKKEHNIIIQENTALKIELANLRKDLIFVDMIDKLKSVRIAILTSLD